MSFFCNWKLSSLLILVAALLPFSVVGRPMQICDCGDYIRNVTKRYRPAQNGTAGSPCGGFIDCEAPGIGCIYQDCAPGTYWDVTSGPDDPVVGKVGICNHIPDDWASSTCTNYCIFIPPPPTTQPTAAPTTPIPTTPPTGPTPTGNMCCPDGHWGMRAATAMGGSGCEGYVQCDGNGGHTVFQVCPANMLFNPNGGYCDWPDNVDCSGGVSCMPSGGVDRHLNEEIVEIQLRGVSGS